MADDDLRSAREKNMEMTIRFYAAAAIRHERRAEALALQVAMLEERLAILGATAYGEAE